MSNDSTWNDQSRGNLAAKVTVDTTNLDNNLDGVAGNVQSQLEAIDDLSLITTAEKAKLAGIEALADVTDQTNVASALGTTDAQATTDTGTVGNAGKVVKLDASGNLDGRDVATDGTKLDTIETNADVTDQTNVATALGSTDAAAVTDTGTAGNAGKVVKLDGSGNLDGRNIDVDGTKLDSIDAGATDDQTGAEIKTAYEAEANTNAYTDADAAKVGQITVTQAVDLDTMESDIATNSAKTTNATHTGDVTGSGALTIEADVVDNTKLANVATSTIKGRVLAGTGDPTDLTAAEVRTLLNVEDGSQATDTTNIASALGTTDAQAVTDTNTGANAGKLVKLDGSGNLDGRDVAADGTKLDGIEASADQTTQTTVTSAVGATDGAAVTDTNNIANAGKLLKLDGNGQLDGSDFSAVAAKVIGIEDGADVTDQSNVTSAVGATDAQAVTDTGTTGNAGKLIKLDAGGKIDGYDVNALGVAAAANTAHAADTANPHGTDLGNLDAGTLAELNAAISDLIGTYGAVRDIGIGKASHRPAAGTAGRFWWNTDSKELERDTGTAWERPSTTPDAHATSHTDGTDDIQDATGSVKGLATAAQITKLNTVETSADVTDLANVSTALGVTEAVAVEVTDTAGNAGKAIKLDSNGNLDGRDVGADGDNVDLNTTHRGLTNNPHSTDLGNLGIGTLVELNALITTLTATYGGIREISLGTVAQMPSFGTAGRFWFSTDTYELSHDTGSAWVDLTVSEIGTQDKLQLNTTGGQSYSAGQISYDATTKSNLSDTGFTGVRVNIGQEQYIRFYNDTGVQINNGEVINAAGVDTTNDVVTGILADASSPATSSAIIGLATHDIPDETWGFATAAGEVRGFDTSGLSEGFMGYASESPGALTNTRVKYPANISILGTCVKSDATDGIFLVDRARFTRTDASKSYTFSNAPIGSGTEYVAGYYDWSATDANLTQAATSITYGTAGAGRAAHVGIVASAAGSVDTGQVGLRVTGTLDSETGVQSAAQTEVITDDITTLTANEYDETAGKFSGNVTIELYVVSGAPTTYSLDFNYGFSKYEDIANQDFTLTAFEAVWIAGAADATFDLELLHHKTTGWTYAATAFVPGNGNICKRLTDQAIDGDLATGVSGAYQRVDLDTFIDGNGSEGILIKVVTGSPNSIRIMDLHIAGVSEELV